MFILTEVVRNTRPNPRLIYEGQSKFTMTWPTNREFVLTSDLAVSQQVVVSMWLIYVRLFGIQVNQLASQPSNRSRPTLNWENGRLICHVVFTVQPPYRGHIWGHKINWDIDATLSVKPINQSTYRGQANQSINTLMSSQSINQSVFHTDEDKTSATTDKQGYRSSYTLQAIR